MTRYRIEENRNGKFYPQKRGFLGVWKYLNSRTTGLQLHASTIEEAIHLLNDHAWRIAELPKYHKYP